MASTDTLSPATGQLQQRLLGRRRQAWREWGQGPVVVLLHGISSGAGSWVKLAQQLAGQFRVLAWDAPGYGGSAPLTNNTQPNGRHYAEVVLDWLDSLGITAPVLLVGHSLGAVKAAAFAQAYPGRVAGLVLADPAQGYGHESAEKRQQIFEKRPKLLKTLGPEGMAAQRAPVLLRPGSASDNVALVAEGMQRLSLLGFSCASYLLAHDRIQRYLPVAALPSQVLCGDQDTITPPAAADQLAQLLGLTGCTLLPQAGHASYIDAPQAFAEALVSFARALPGYGVK